MGRISHIERDDADETVRRVYDEFFKARGNVPNMFKTLAHSPGLMTATTDYFKRVMAPGKISVKLKEMLAVRVSQLHLCGY